MITLTDETTPPPAYSRVVTRIYPYSLRPVILAFGIIIFFYGIILGTSALRDIEDDSSKEKVWDGVLGGLWVLIGLVGFGTFVIAFMHKLPLMKLWYPIAITAGLLAIITQVLQVVYHYSNKADEVSVCAKEYVGETGYDDNGDLTTITQAEAESLCLNSWNRNTLRDFFELILAVVLASIFILITSQYYRQLVNPSAVRVRGQLLPRSGHDYPMEAPTIPYGYGEPGQGPIGYQPYQQGGGGYVPPYPGPPPADSPYAPRGPNASAREEDEDAKAPTLSSTEGKDAVYKRSGGANGSDVALADEMGYEAQEEAWRAARERSSRATYEPPVGSPPGREVV